MVRFFVLIVLTPFLTLPTIAVANHVVTGVWSGYTIYVSGKDVRITGFGSNTQARNSGEAWADTNGCYNCETTVGFDGHGGYQVTIQPRPEDE